MLEVADVSFGYGEELTLDHVSAKFEKGEAVGIIGPNGAGKSTLLSVLAGTLRPKSGFAALDGKNLAECSARFIARRISVVPQKADAAFDFTAFDTVMMGRQARMSRFQTETQADKVMADEALAQMNMKKLRDRGISHLSGGEFQRVLIARAIAQDTGIMLLDEPIASLDMRHQLSVLEKLRARAHGEGQLIICVIHDLNLAAAYFDRLILMQDGRIIRDGKPADVLTRGRIGEVYGVDADVTNDEAGVLWIRPKRSVG